MKKFVLLVSVVLLSLFFTPKLEAQTVSCSQDVGSGQPTGIAVDSSGNAWVAFAEGNYVLELSPSNCGIVNKVTTETGPTAVAFDGSNIWVTNNGSSTVSKIDASSGSYLATYPVGSDPRGVVFDGTYIWVANQGSNTVTKLQPSNGAVLGNFAVGSEPFGLAVDTANTTIWVTNVGSNNLMVLNQSGTIQHTVTTGSKPEFLTFDGTNMWVNCYNSDTVEQISPSGVVLKNISVSSGGHPTGLTWDPYDGLIWGVTWGGYLYSLNPSTNAVSYSYWGGHNQWTVLFDSSTRFLWETNIENGIVYQVVP
jgi:YVTN family beta-propeller protein